MATERLIDGNALMAKFERIAQKSGVPHFHLDEIADEINEADAVEVVHGSKAESVISKTGLMCTACYSDIDRDAVFCKYCGAKMDGDGNE